MLFVNPKLHTLVKFSENSGYQDKILYIISIFFTLRGNDFRTDFKELSCLKAFFPKVPILALTATAPPLLIKRLRQSLCLDSDVKIINKNPNRENVFLDKKIRLPNQYGTTSYEEILKPIAQELLKQREKCPMTIVYLKLKYCG